MSEWLYVKSIGNTGQDFKKKKKKKKRNKNKGDFGNKEAFFS